MGAEQRKALIREIQQKRGSHLICCLTSDRDNAQGLIAKDFLFRFFQHLRTMKELKKLDVLLFTLGGDTLAAYALARLVRRFAGHVEVLVPHMCMSAGTLFALGADKIVMTKLASLSAIDPSITGINNPTVDVPTGVPGAVAGQRVPVPVGVESVAGFKKLVREEWRLDEEGTAAAFHQLAEKVNPILLGDLQRSKEQIVRLATNLMRLHKDPLDLDRIAAVVETLATKLGSHDYLIGVDEARDIKLHVQEKDDPQFEESILKLYEDFAAEMKLGIPFNPADLVIQAQTQTQPQRPGQVIASEVVQLVVIESLERTDVWEREFVLAPPAPIQVRRNYWRK